MAFLQTIDPFCQPMGAATIAPNPYTIDPFCQPLTEEIAPPPPPTPPPRRGGGGAATRIVLPRVECPEGTYWDPDLRRCCPLPPAQASRIEPTSEPEGEGQISVDPYTARTTAAAIAFAIDPPNGYEVLSAEIALEIDNANDPEEEDDDD